MGALHIIPKGFQKQAEWSPELPELPFQQTLL